ncbi:hypothetical protein PILCRDRAFT_16429 [Piloderma croceum F 1598]|uniref:CHAT domain-containing protein n=1 Tax=Piloderma croceum (strain F 1598) TaxID=765440 RepID=A0A0C3EWJ3_PILCF|nr:hypothetical protein PILCRDRAFT_16429 [Piloderma croceum F 1598]
MLSPQATGHELDSNAIKNIYQSIQFLPNTHPKRSIFLVGVGNIFAIQSQRSQNQDALHKAVNIYEEAMRNASWNNSQTHIYAAKYGTALLDRFERMGIVDDINKSILMFEDAVRLIPDGHPDKPSLLGGLRNSLSRRFERLGDLGDINKSILMNEDAVRLTPDGHPDKPSKLNNLGISPLSALAISPSFLNNLGNSLSRRFERLGDLGDINKSGQMYEEAVKSNTGSFSIRFIACSRWAMHCQRYNSHSVLDAYSVAFRLLPNMAWLSLSIADRHHFLERVGPVVRDAVSAAIGVGQYKTAVAWMDQGNSVIWGQLLQLHSPLDELKQHHPNIASSFTELSKKLEGAGTAVNFKATSSNGPQLSLETTSECYHDLADERDRLLHHIRGLDGFDQFLLPRTLSQLQVAARNGPIISINVGKTCCDALILMPELDDILHIPLEHFTHEAAEALHRLLRHLLRSKGCNILHDIDLETRASDDFCNDSLAEAAFELILSQTSPLRDENQAMRLVSPFHNSETAFQTILAYIWHTVMRPILDIRKIRKKLNLT